MNQKSIKSFFTQLRKRKVIRVAIAYVIGGLNREWLLHDSHLDNAPYHPRFAKLLASFPG
ncbi:MAG TPA: hypothetical protein VI566_05525 [Xanthomonadales bacterium]|nr:hypothetical protein [Xanthomonadales bacterium]